MTPSDIQWLAAPVAAFFLAAAAPGPATLAVSTTAMAHGRRTATALGLGLGVGLAAWGALVAAGLGALVLESPRALFVFRIVGGGYLLWLAYAAARSAVSPEPASATPSFARGRGRAFRQGLLLNLLNPKAALAWAAIIAVGLPSGDGGADRVALLTAVCASLGLAIYLVLAAAFSRPTARSVYDRTRRGVEGAIAALFAAFGLRLLLDPA